MFNLKRFFKFKANIAFLITSLCNWIITLTRHVLWPMGKQTKVKRICIYRVGMIGDILFLLPTFYSIRKKFPNAHITVFTSFGADSNSSVLDLLTTLPWIDCVKPYYSKDSKTAWDIARLIITLRGASFDLWVSLPQSNTTLLRQLREMMFARLSGAKYAFGFNVRRTTIFKHEQALAHTFENEANFSMNMMLQARMGIEVKEHEDLNITGKIDSDIQYQIDCAINTNSPILAIAPGAKRNTNRWPIARFAEVALKWISRGGYVVIIGAESDMHLAQQIEAVNFANILNLCGKTSLVETMSIMKQSTVALTNDSGPMHLAASVHVPLVVVFSARDFPGLWHPTGAKNTIIRKMVHCSPCLAEACHNENLCMKLISVEEVFTQLEKYLNAKLLTPAHMN